MWVTSLFLPEPPGKYGNFLPRVQMETGPPRHEGTRPGPCGLDGASPGFRELCTLCCRGPWFPVFPCVSCIHPCYPFPWNVSVPTPTLFPMPSPGLRPALLTRKQDHPAAAWLAGPGLGFSRAPLHLELGTRCVPVSHKPLPSCPLPGALLCLLCLPLQCSPSAVLRGLMPRCPEHTLLPLP